MAALSAAKASGVAPRVASAWAHAGLAARTAASHWIDGRALSWMDAAWTLCLAVGLRQPGLERRVPVRAVRVY